MQKFRQRAHDALFQRIHGARLIYNTCWEDPRLDRRMLQLGEDSRVAVITSAGDNALEYLLDNPAQIDCVDMNHRQNALLELKRAFFLLGDHAALNAFFGQGGAPGFADMYRAVRPVLSAAAAEYWDKKISYFEPVGLRPSFYYRGGAGTVAWAFAKFLGVFKPGLRQRLLRLLDAASLEEQRSLYADIEPRFWGPLSRWLVARPWTMAMLGVPRPQIALIQARHEGGLEGFIKDKVRRVFTEVPVADNYFWRVYLTGSYSATCRPEYLKPENFRTIRERIERLHAHTDTMSGFLGRSPGRYTHFVLLDHQDWLAWHAPEALREEWELVLANAAPGAKILMRSAGLDLSFVPRLARARLRFFPEITEPLHAKDRVGTYGSQHLAVVV